MIRRFLIPAVTVAALAGALLGAAPARAEQLVSGLSKDRVAITANFNGSDILVFGAVKRDRPIPPGPPLDVIMTLQGPSQPLIVRKKERKFGIWVNSEAVTISGAPSFYAIATSAPLAKSLSATDDLRYRITIPKAIRAVGTASEAPDAPRFTDALIRLREKNGLYKLNEGSVDFQAATLFNTSIALPSNLTEGAYKLRIFLTRGGTVLDSSDSVIEVRREGLERWLYRLSKDQPLAYGVLSLFIAIAAGWLASTAFRIAKSRM
ncbi:TIGR02186 family protein [Acidimangrovimonas pyrenivorans]|uniref:TIGR02186 family protein n=1 Tax=Acidimangrovimonas pyrenivorans TaxID=2030798 RepID=A0ABV7AKN7_9RHOB